MRTDDNYIRTYTGKRFWPLDPRPEDVDIVDIAHALSNQCRFTGHCTEFYSVAEHSLRVVGLCQPSLKMAALLHDADEAYLVDLARPVKHTPEMEFFVKAGEAIHKAVADAFNVDSNLFVAVKPMDIKAYEQERESLMPSGGYEHPPMFKPLPPREAELAFLNKFYQLRAQETTFDRHPANWDKAR